MGSKGQKSENGRAEYQIKGNDTYTFFIMCCYSKHLGLQWAYFIHYVTMSNDRNIRISDGCVYAQIRKGLGMHLVIYTNCDTVPFLLLVQYKGGLSEIEFTVTLFSNVGMIFLSFLQIVCISSYIKGGIAHFCYWT